MLIKECEECRYLQKMIAVGQGVRCTHPKHFTDKTKLPPIIATIEACKVKESRQKR